MSISSNQLESVKLFLKGYKISLLLTLNLPAYQPNVIYPGGGGGQSASRYVSAKIVTFLFGISRANFDFNIPAICMSCYYY